MKHTLFILALITASIQTFAQSPRIKLNQITKDSVTGSVLISSPTDSGMVYSRDLFISYGADTVLILGGDTLAATSNIISSVISDGVTITGDGTLGSELTVDTATVIATKQDLDLKQDQLNGTGFVKASGTTISYDNSTYLTSEVDGSVTNEGSLTVGAGGANDAVVSSNTSGSSDVTISGGTNVTVTESGQTITIASSGGAIPVDTFVTIAGTETITGAKTFTAALTQSGGDVNFDSGTLFVDESADRVGINSTNPGSSLDIVGGAGGVDWVRIIRTGVIEWAINADGGNFNLNNNTANANRFMVTQAGDVGIGTSPSVQLELSTDGAKKLTTTTWTTGSDRRIKKNIINYDKGLNEIIQLNPVEYELNGKANTINGAKGIGLIAQEVQPIIPEAVIGYYGKLNEDDEFDSYLYNINTHSFFFMFINAFKEQQAIIESQATEIETLKTLITELSNRLTILENN